MESVPPIIVAPGMLVAQLIEWFVPWTRAKKLRLVPGFMIADEGETVTATIVTVALADATPSQVLLAET